MENNLVWFELVQFGLFFMLHLIRLILFSIHAKFELSRCLVCSTIEMNMPIAYPKNCETKNTHGQCWKDDKIKGRRFLTENEQFLLLRKEPSAPIRNSPTVENGSQSDSTDNTPQWSNTNKEPSKWKNYPKPRKVTNPSLPKSTTWQILPHPLNPKLGRPGAWITMKNTIPNKSNIMKLKKFVSSLKPTVCFRLTLMRIYLFDSY